MCDFLDLDLAHRKREDLVVAIATGFAVPIDSKHKKKKNTGAFAKAMRAAEELLTLSVCLLEAPFEFTKLGTEQLPRFALDATARGVGAAIAGGGDNCASLAWRACFLFERALRSDISGIRTAAAEALSKTHANGRNDFADAVSCLLFRRHDVGVTRPFCFNLRRLWDVVFREPEYVASVNAKHTGYVLSVKRTKAWNGKYLTEWPQVLRHKARALLEFDGSGGVIETGDPDGKGDEKTHNALRALDHTGVVLGRTPLCAAGRSDTNTEQPSLKEMRTNKALRRKQRAKSVRWAGVRAEPNQDSSRSGVATLEKSRTGFAAGTTEDSSDDNATFDLRDAAAHDVAALRRAEKHPSRRYARASNESSAKTAAQSLRRFAPSRRNYVTPAPNSFWGFVYAIGASHALRKARITQDTTRIALANAIITLLLDAALQGEDELLSAGVGGASRSAAVAVDEKELGKNSSNLPDMNTLSIPPCTLRLILHQFLGLRVEQKPTPKPASVPSSGAAAAVAAVSALVLRAGGVGAFLRVAKYEGSSETTPTSPASPVFLTCALRACGGAGRPAVVISRASEFITALLQRRQARAALLRRLGEVCRLQTGVSKSGVSVLNVKHEHTRVSIALSALGAIRRACDLAKRDRCVAATLCIHVAHASFNGDRLALDGTTDDQENGKMFLKLRARAACDAARRVDLFSVIETAKGVLALLYDTSPDVRIAVAFALRPIGALLVAAEASFVATAVGNEIGEIHHDWGDADVPANRWALPFEDWETPCNGVGDDMRLEDTRAEEKVKEAKLETKRKRKNKAAAPALEGNGFDFENRPPTDEESGTGQPSDDNSKQDPTGPHTWDPLAGMHSTPAQSRLFDSGRLVTSLEKAGRMDKHPGARDALLGAVEEINLRRARATHTAIQIATGGLLGAHVCTWACLNDEHDAHDSNDPKRHLPGGLDVWAISQTCASSKFQKLTEKVAKPNRRRVGADQRKLGRAEMLAARLRDAEDADVSLRRDAWFATRKHLVAFGFDPGVESVGGNVVNQPEDTQQLSSNGLNATAVEATDLEAPSETAVQGKLQSAAVQRMNKATPNRPSRDKVSSAGKATEEHDAVLSFLRSVKAKGRTGAVDDQNELLTTSELLKTTGPTPQALDTVKLLLRKSVRISESPHSED